jgi:MiaB/RimO family radical SAM methylthiotransferase
MEYSVFGCRLNKYYLNQWLDYFRSHSFANQPYLITTCEVTDRAKQKRIKLAKKKLSEWCHLYITWCGTLKRGEVISTELFYNLYPEFIPFSDSITLLWEHPDEVSSFTTTKENVYTKKFVVIQNGCDNYCSFCLTVQKRGKHTSRSREEIVQEINEFAQSWGKEIVLTWVNIAAWWCTNSTKQEESKFTELLTYILDNTTIPRIRISSLGPEYLDDAFFKVIENPRILPHFHLSIQSFSDTVLQRMKRNYTVKILANVLAKFHALKTIVPLSLWADIIIGFPGETEEEFKETLHGIQTYNINKVHPFPFSAHTMWETVPASVLANQIDQVTKKLREKELKKIADHVLAQFIELNRNIEHSVLVEWKWSGWTQNYIKVPVDSKYKRGEIIQIFL